MRKSSPLAPLNWPQIGAKLDAATLMRSNLQHLPAKTMSFSRRTTICLGKTPKELHKTCPNHTNFTRFYSGFLLVLLLVSIGLSTFASGAAGEQHQKQPTAATNAYGEPIKWSFGGWAPLDGQQPGARKNQTAGGSTTPLPPMDPSNPHRTTAAVGAQPPAEVRQRHNGRRPAGESLNESASSTYGKVQFVAPQQEPNRPNLAPERAPQQHQIHGPAMQRQSHFSPPAPMPIVREHLLPAAANYHQEQGRGSLGPHHMPHQHQMHQHQQQQQQHHHHHQQRQQQQQQQMMMIAAQQYPRPPVSMHEHERRLEQQHRQQMLRHHHQLMMHHQQQQQQHHRQPMSAQMVQQQLYRNPPGQEAKMIQLSGQHLARFPQSAPTIEGYRVVEGEHPIIFTPPAGVMEQAVANYTNQRQQQQHRPTSQAPYASTLGANEKDNLDYQGALRQVSSAGSYEQSNNIQDIKQKQQYEQHQQQQQQHQPQGQADKQPEQPKAGSYLTIPVAVETEGDKVLTADDINEIQKHVIQVLPNLKTADKVVKLADTKLTLASANLKDAIQQQQAVGANAAHTLHQLNYEEHRSTMKQLEDDLRGDKQYNSPPSTALPSSASPSPSSSSSSPSSPSSSAAYSSQHGSSTTAALNQATTNAHVHHQQPKSIDDGHQLPEQQYFLATGPLQEVGTVEPDQLSEYNLIQNDLLKNLRYEPTRASNSGSQHHHHQQQQQGASTPPMPYTASQTTGSHRPASVTRYFQQGNRMYQQHQLEPTSIRAAPGQQQHQHGRTSNLFGRIQAPGARAQLSSTTKTIGGRKVSEVMRNLIHTTPVPMTSPMHVASVEPEKVDSISLIASHGNDNKPMVVEPHQLVQHTPEGGFDYSSGGMSSSGNSNNGNNYTGGQQFEQQMGPSGEAQRAQYGSPAPQMMEQPGGAVIEYVTVGDQALSGVLGGAQNEGTYEIANQPEVQPVYHNAGEQQQQQQQENPNEASHSSRAPFVYDYTMSADQQQTASPAGGSEQAGGYSLSQPSMQQQQQQHHNQQQAGEPQMFTWSPSIANEHQQQQAELSEHAAPGHQMDLPATAGYNFFGQSGEQQPAKETGQEYEQQPQQQQQQQQYQEPQQNGKWRSKAGGSQPNPDAQYDGQIAKGVGEHEYDHDEAQNSQPPAEGQQYQSPAGSGHEAQVQQQHQQMETRQPENQGDGPDAYQEKSQHEHEHEQQSSTSSANQQVGDGYLATNSYAAGAQFNHQRTPSHDNYDHKQRENDQSGRYNYVKLDHDRQQSHLAQQQAQRQAQMAEIMSNQQQIYQTTTPMSPTTVASAAQQQQPGESDYGREQSLPSVQPSPESMLINESPMSMPILDQQSLISDPSQDSNPELANDDGAKQSQPAAVYQVYQAYYAPKDHKPLPGYVRLSLEEFNELFRDAEIQYVDKNQANGANRPNPNPEAQHAYEQAQPSAGNQNDLMKASASEPNQSIVVDRRSITAERRASNSSSADSDSSETLAKQRKLKFAGAVKKIISIRNSRQAARQQLLKSSSLKHELQQKKSNLETTTTSSGLLSSVSSSNNPTTKQQPNVSTKASNTHKDDHKQQSANKRKSAAAITIKKPLNVAPNQTATVSKDRKVEKSKPSSPDGGSKRSTSTTNDKTGPKATH